MRCVRRLPGASPPMTDLFGEPRKTAPEPRQRSASFSGGLKGKPRNLAGERNLAKARGSSPPPNEVRGLATFRPSASKVAPNNAELRQDYAKAAEEAIFWRGQMVMAQAALEPFEAKFMAAHRYLEGMARQRLFHVGDRVLKDAYDARMAAGCAAHPYRKKAAECARILKAITDELRDLSGMMETKR